MLLSVNFGMKMYLSTTISQESNHSESNYNESHDTQPNDPDVFDKTCDNLNECTSIKRILDFK